MKKTESYIQQQCLIWFNNNYCLKKHNPRCIMFSVPNEVAMKVRGALMYNGISKKIVDKVVNPTINEMKNIGMKPGVSDTIVVMPGVVLFLEFKTDDGVQSEEQKEFQSIISLLGYKYFIIRNEEEFKRIIIDNSNLDLV